MKYKNTITVFLLLFCILLLGVPQVYVDGACIHNLVQNHDVQQKEVSYQKSSSQKMDENRHSKRATKDILYKPLRIHVEFNEIAKELTNSEEQRLRRVVEQTVEKISNTLSVIPVNGALTLTRSESSCSRKWNDGPNSGKCASINSNYVGETCLDNFKIPDAHLDGLYIWDSTDPSPVQEIVAPGSGVASTDFILYITATTSSSCIRSGRNVIAYAAYCQLDQNSRPIAGFANFCPFLVKDTNIEDDKLALSALHEFFHALGFSSDLFDKFRDCSGSDSGLDCPLRQARPVETLSGKERLVTPRVDQVTSDHFNCHKSTDKFGPIMEQNEAGEYFSHWDGAFMYGSIMAPTIGLPSVTKLDKITLAYFEDTGWYQVNYAMADNYVWGKDGGCDFGLQGHCAGNSPYFCQGSGVGCHHQHQHKAVCSSDSSLHQCRVYKPQPQDSCMDSSNSPGTGVTTKTGEVYGPDSRCFLSSLYNLSEEGSSTAGVEGRCYRTRCVNDSVEIQAGAGSSWVPCHYGLTVQIVGYGGDVECPQKGILCVKPVSDLSTSASPIASAASTSATAATSATTQADEEPHPEPEVLPSKSTYPRGEVLCIDVVFGSINYKQMSEEGLLTAFQTSTETQILATTGINGQRLGARHMFEGSLVYRFNLLPPKPPPKEPDSRYVYDVLQVRVESGNFTVQLTPGGTIYTATSISISPDGPVELLSSDPPPGVIIGIVLGSLAAALLIGALMFIMQRYYSMQSRIIPNQRQEMRPVRRSADPETGEHRRNQRSCPISAWKGRKSERQTHGQSEDSCDLVKQKGQITEDEEEAVSTKHVVLTNKESPNEPR